MIADALPRPSLPYPISPTGAQTLKRDLDLCREILRQMAESPTLNAPVEVAVEGRSRDEITYQLHIMRQADLIEATEGWDGDDGLVCFPLGLTWRGNEFLDAASDDTIWNRAKARFGKAGGALTFDLLLAACKAPARAARIARVRTRVRPVPRPHTPQLSRGAEFR